MIELILLIIRAVQAIFSIIVLGLTAYGTILCILLLELSDPESVTVDDYAGSIDRNSFLLFTSICE